MPLPLYTANQVRELDRQAIEVQGIPGLTLMERAGAAAFAELRRRWPSARSVIVLCGLGNNAGDGFVVSRLAHVKGLDVTAVLVGDPAKLQGDARSAFAAMRSAGVATANHSGVLADADVYVDALLGTGLDREVSGTWKTVIEQANQRPGARLAIDIPTGLHADTGRIMGTAFRADCTVTFIGRKRGLYTGMAADVCGDIVFNDLDVPADTFAAVRSNVDQVTWEDLQNTLAPRSRSAHKGHFGHVLVIGGDHGYSGAARMAAEAAARCGAGLVSVATRKAHAATINIGRPELMCQGVETIAELLPLLEKAGVVVIGPGLGQSEWSVQMLSRVGECRLPMVMDADALNLLAREPVTAEQRIITPHPGEAARLLGCTTADIQADRYAAVEALQQSCGGIAVLKGSGTLVADGEGRISVHSGGNPGMASGGMGDVLTGVTAALLAQGSDPATAARLGVSLHARAADRAAGVDGERGLLAGDLFPHLRKLLNYRS